jgi:SAM-dependent methyltransferase
VARKLEAIQPQVAAVARRNRAFLGRVVRFLLDQGIRQFLDLGSGIPTVGNVHEVAQEVDPGAKVVYVDHEPVAVAHSRLLLKGNPHAEALEADATNAEAVLKSGQVDRLLDLGKPVGLLAITLGHYLPEVRGVFAAYRDALAPGSYLALTHLTNDFAVLSDPRVAETMRKTQDHIHPRTKTEVRALFDGFELVEPGLTTSANWRPDRLAAVVDPEEDGLYAGVGVKV